MPSMPEAILLVDDDSRVLESTARLLTQEFGYTCLRAETGAAAVPAMRQHLPETVLLDLGLPDLNGEDVLLLIKKNFPEVPIIMVTAMADLETAVRCMGQGAYDYVVKGSDPSRLIASVRRALESRRKSKEIEALRERMQSATLRYPAAFAPIITISETMRSIFRFIEAIAGTDEPILIQGETGTGKELFAKSVHLASGTRGPFVATNLGGLDDQMVSDSLFGHVKGAYTGADEARKGLVATAAGGTLFLDEIGELSPSAQVKLLRFLETREYYPLGSDLPRQSDARIVAATNRNLAAMAETGQFRRDLLYRLSTYRVDIPPLRDRIEDLPTLCRHFFSTISEAGQEWSLTREALALLETYSFPGNVRELRSLLLKAKVLGRGNPITSDVMAAVVSLPGQPVVTIPETPVTGNQDKDPGSPAPAVPTIKQAIESLIDRAMSQTKGQQNAAAKLLGISPQALSKRLRKSSE